MRYKKSNIIDDGCSRLTKNLNFNIDSLCQSA
jgi:hypothetical protein